MILVLADCALCSTSYREKSCGLRESTLRHHLLSFYPHWHKLSSSFTHPRAHWLTHAYRCAHTVTDCDAAEVKPHLWVTLQLCRDNDSLCWKTLDMPSRITLPLSHAPSFWMSVSLHVFWREMPIAWTGCRWGERERCNERRRVRDMKRWEITVLSEPRLIKAL